MIKKKEGKVWMGWKENEKRTKSKENIYVMQANANLFSQLVALQRLL